MSDTSQKLDISLAELVNLSAKILDQLFIRAPKDKAKPVFKDIKDGKSVNLGTVTFGKLIESKLDLTLDYSEFRGPRFNFDAFQEALHGILKQISDTFKTKGNLNVLSNDQAGVIIHLPGVIRLGEQYNVMLLSYDLKNLNNIKVNLIFVDPSQYEKQPETAEEE